MLTCLAAGKIVVEACSLTLIILSHLVTIKFNINYLKQHLSCLSLKNPYILYVYAHSMRESCDA